MDGHLGACILSAVAASLPPSHSLSSLPPSHSLCLPLSPARLLAWAHTGVARGHHVLTSQPKSYRLRLTPNAEA
jgi:hypothetical protein